MKKRPNLFDFATSELSQDAFLTWLIQWADGRYQGIDSSLNSCAISFVRELCGKDNSFKVESVKVGRQWKNIDIWALVNNQYFIVIEDKKGSKEHSNQLNRYSEIANRYYEKSIIEVILVYYKMEEQDNYSGIREAGYTTFHRSNMLSILGQYMDNTLQSKQNDIIADYYLNLKELDAKINSYLNTPVDQWHWYSWQGFYSELQNHIQGKWKYVSNPSGGFLGFYWNRKHSKIRGKEFEYYLQLEQDQLVFKLYSYNEDDRRIIRDFYRKILLKKAKTLNIEISRFGRLGKYMSIAKLIPEYRVKDDNGLIRIQDTIELLRDVSNLINETEREIATNQNNHSFTGGS